MDERMIDVEMKVAFLEKHVEDLDAVIRGLSDQLVALGRRVERLALEGEKDDEGSQGS